MPTHPAVADIAALTRLLLERGIEFILVGGLPNWGYHKFGFAPSGAAGFVLLIVVILLLTGRL